MYQSIDELRDEMKKAHQIIVSKPEIQKCTIPEVLDTLFDGTQEMRHYRWEVAAILYVDRLLNYSYDYLATELASSDNPEHLYSYIMFVLQEEHNVSCIYLLKSSLEHDTFSHILPLVSHNICFESDITKEVIVVFLSIMKHFPRNMEYDLFSSFSAKIVDYAFDAYTFNELVENKPEKADSFLPYLLERVYKKVPDIGNSYLESLIHFSQPDEWISSIIVGIRCSLQTKNDYFEEALPILQRFSKNKQKWGILIPCFIEYCLRKEKRKNIRKSILESLQEIVLSTLDGKLIFLNDISYRTDIPDDLDALRVFICSNSIDRNNDVLDALSSYYYHNRNKLPISDVLKQLYTVFVVNEYSIENYHDFFDSFSNLWPDYSKFQHEIWSFFLHVLFEPKEESLPFAVGLFENAMTFSNNEAIEDDLRIDEETACLVMQIMNVFTMHSESIIMFCFTLLRYLHGDIEQFVKSFFDEIYISYPYTSHKIAKKYIDSSESIQQELAKKIINQYEKDNNDQNKWKAVPDLWPSEERHVIAQKVLMEQNEKLNKSAEEKNFFSRYFSKQFLKYGKRSGFIQYREQGKKDYISSEYASIKVQIELPVLYVNTPVEWFVHRKKVLEMRRDYIAAHH